MSAKNERDHFTTEELLAEFDAAQKWLERFGASTKNGRLSSYRQILEEARDAGKSGAAGWDDSRRHALFAAGCEIFDFIEISKIDDQIVKPHAEKIQKLAAGSDFYDQVIPGEEDHGRDVAFELLTASVVHRSGAVAKLEAPSDIFFSDADFQGHIECKRPKTEGGFVRLVISASAQLAKHRKNGMTGMAVVAIDVTRLVNPNLEILIAENQGVAFEVFHKSVNNRVSDLGKLLMLFEEQLHQEGEIDAILSRCTAMSINREVGFRPEVLTAMQVCPQDLDETSTRCKAARRFAELLQRAGNIRF